jgi:hypothetical protein
MKSAYEIAMSRLEKDAPSRELSEEQKKALAEIDSECDARIAEQRIFLEGEIAKSRGHDSLTDQLRQQLAGEIALIEERREKKKNRIRSGETN